MLDSANTLANRFQQLNNSLNTLNSEVNNGLTAAATEINRLAAEIAQINGVIGSNAATAAPDLLDRRDQLIANLVGYTGGTAVAGWRHPERVHRRRPGPGGRYHRLEGDHGHRPYQPERLQLALQTQGGKITLDPKQLGGQVGGMLEFRDTVLTPAQAELGKLAVGLATTFNETHRNGVDLYGNMGGDLFNIGSPRVTGNTSNTGTASITASYGDLSSLDAQNIVLKYDGTQWLAMRSDTGASVAMTGTGTATDPLKINGVELVVSGTPATMTASCCSPPRAWPAASAWRSPIPRAWPRPRRSRAVPRWPTPAPAS